jgi:hypothetical protein
MISQEKIDLVLLITHNPPIRLLTHTPVAYRYFITRGGVMFKMATHERSPNYYYR